MSPQPVKCCVSRPRGCHRGASLFSFPIRTTCNENLYSSLASAAPGGDAEPENRLLELLGAYSHGPQGRNSGWRLGSTLSRRRTGGSTGQPQSINAGRCPNVSPARKIP